MNEKQTDRDLLSSVLSCFAAAAGEKELSFLFFFNFPKGRAQSLVSLPLVQ